MEVSERMFKETGVDGIVLVVAADLRTHDKLPVGIKDELFKKAFDRTRQLLEQL